MKVTIDTEPVALTGPWSNALLPEEDMIEPHPGSVVLTNGEFGTAWQRHGVDGLWHSTRRTGGPKTWEWLLTKRHLVLVYDAREQA